MHFAIEAFSLLFILQQCLGTTPTSEAPPAAVTTPTSEAPPAAVTTPSPGCLIDENTFLGVNEIKQLPGCTEVKCMYLTGHFVSVGKKCPSAQKKPSAGCKLLPSNDKDFPECCVQVYECVQVVQKLVPVVYSYNNISLLHEGIRKKLLNTIGISQDDSSSSIINNKINDDNTRGFDHKIFDEDAKKFIKESLYKIEVKN